MGTRRVVQIAVAAVSDAGQQMEESLYALCDDGSVFTTRPRWDRLRGFIWDGHEWLALNPVPQPGEGGE